MKKYFFCFISLTLVICAVMMFAGCEMDNQQDGQIVKGYVATVNRFEIYRNKSSDMKPPTTGMRTNAALFYYEYYVDGNMDSEIYYDVNVQIAFYLGNEYIKTVEDNFHLRGNGSTFKKGYVSYMLDDFYTQEEILKLPIMQQTLSSKVLKTTWK